MPPFCLAWRRAQESRNRRISPHMPPWRPGAPMIRASASRTACRAQEPGRVSVHSHWACGMGAHALCLKMQPGGCSGAACWPSLHLSCNDHANVYEAATASKDPRRKPKCEAQPEAQQPGYSGGTTSRSVSLLRLAMMAGRCKQAMHDACRLVKSLCMPVEPAMTVAVHRQQAVNETRSLVQIHSRQGRLAKLAGCGCSRPPQSCLQDAANKAWASPRLQKCWTEHTLWGGPLKCAGRADQHCS